MSTELTINADQTISSKWVGEKGRGSLFQVMSSGNVEYVNVLDENELYAVIGAVAACPFPLGRGEEIYRKILEKIKTDPGYLFKGGKPDVSLGDLRKYLVLKAGEGCNAPHDSYLRIAYSIKTGKSLEFSY